MLLDALIKIFGVFVFMVESITFFISPDCAPIPGINIGKSGAIFRISFNSFG